MIAADWWAGGAGAVTTGNGSTNRRFRLGASERKKLRDDGKRCSWIDEHGLPKQRLDLAVHRDRPLRGRTEDSSSSGNRAQQIVGCSSEIVW